MNARKQRLGGAQAWDSEAFFLPCWAAHSELVLVTIPEGSRPRFSPDLDPGAPQLLGVHHSLVPQWVLIRGYDECGADGTNISGAHRGGSPLQSGNGVWEVLRPPSPPA